ncbi:hypothetical protein LYNGBM3L_68190 [Moorena producens 3L]|uniref:Uncharacterized protein n=1 Tax=Moorena producens 3L TaxID=489825 RepID=F4Y2P0_9CYAN|nr:hypothetical protein LYNGBM3L_68190 [Moorena producens 3L]
MSDWQLAHQPESIIFLLVAIPVSEKVKILNAIPLVILPPYWYAIQGKRKKNELIIC